MAAYSDTVMDHFENPRNAGEMDAPDGEATVRNPVCGDRMQVMLRIDDGRIAKMQWLTRGCPPAIATSSWTSEHVEGWTLDGGGGAHARGDRRGHRRAAEGQGALQRARRGCAEAKAIADYRSGRADGLRLCIWSQAVV